MTNKHQSILLTLLFYLITFNVLISYHSLTLADPTLLIATVSNFTNTAKELAKQFNQNAKIKVAIISGSTGKLYAKINAGAPYDIFLSADIKHSQQLLTKNLAIFDSLTIYAVGKLVLFIPNVNLQYANNLDNLSRALSRLKNFTYIAIASPELSPYGQATKEALIKLELWDKIQSNLVLGENINQSLQFILSDSSKGGFIALSQAIEQRLNPDNFLILDQTLYQPIVQSGVILKKTNYPKEAFLFMRFLHSDEAKTIIKKHGYDIYQMNGTI